MKNQTALERGKPRALPAAAAAPTRPADIQVLDGTAYVLDAETRETVFTVELDWPGAVGQMALECWRRGYETMQLRQNAKGGWRFYRHPRKG